MSEILHIITGLEAGGAENSLLKISRNLKKNNHIKVISLTKDGPVGEKLRSEGIETIILNLSFSFPALIRIVRCIKLIKSFNPQVVNTWMYHADLFGSILSILSGSKNIIWCIRNNVIKSKDVKVSTQIVARVCAYFSNFIPTKIIYNSVSSQSYHENFGYNSRKSLVIDNGFEIKSTNNKKISKQLYCEKLRINPQKKIVSFIARYDKVKNHISFLSEFSKSSSIKEEMVLVLAGAEIDKSNSMLTYKIKELGLEKYVILLGQLDNLDELYCASDLIILPSSSEAFPNVLAEAMSCGTPCLSNNVGECKNIIGDTGFINYSNKINDFIKMLDTIIKSEINHLPELGILAKNRIENHFSIEKMISKFNEVYK